MSSVFSKVSLPCGRTVSNRLAKVALYEHLADFYGGPPNKHHFSLYEAWSRGPVGYGMVFTGNIMITDDHMSLGRDITLPAQITKETLEPYKKLARAIHTSPDSLAIMQLNHSGRQSSRVTNGRRAPLAPSAVRVGGDIPWSNFLAKLLYTGLFLEPRAMTGSDIEHVISRFVFGAQLAHQAGFDGIELHAAHGYLLAQFMSPKVNIRTDEFSATTSNDLHLLYTIVSRIRGAVPKEFVLGIKINAADYSTSSNDELSSKQVRGLNHIKDIALWGGVDFIEVSGGDYESPDFVTHRSNSQRQVFFSHISSKAIEMLEAMPRQPGSAPLPLILLTGGLRTPASLQAALNHNHAQLLGIGRSSVICPDIPSMLKSLGENATAWPDTPFGPEPRMSLPSYAPKIPLLGANSNVAWYEMQIRYLARRTAAGSSLQEQNPAYPDYNLTGWDAMYMIWFWYSEGGPMDSLQRPLLYLVVAVALSHLTQYVLWTALDMPNISLGSAVP